MQQTKRNKKEEDLVGQAEYKMPLLGDAET